MGIVVDLIFLIILAFFVFIGIHKGLAGSLFKLVSFFAAIVIAIILYKPFSSLIINKTEIDDKIKGSIILKFSEEESKRVESNENTDKDGKKEKSVFLRKVSEDVSKAAENEKNKIVESSAERISKSVVNIGSGIVVFLIARIILLIVSFFLKEITKLPLLKQIDKVGGAAYGLLEGLIIIYVVLGIISLTSLLWNSNGITKAIEDSAVTSKLYDNNIIINMFFR